MLSIICLGFFFISTQRIHKVVNETELLMKTKHHGVAHTVHFNVNRKRGERNERGGVG